MLIRSEKKWQVFGGKSKLRKGVTGVFSLMIEIAVVSEKKGLRKNIAQNVISH